MDEVLHLSIVGDQVMDRLKKVGKLVRMGLIEGVCKIYIIYSNICFSLD